MERAANDFTLSDLIAESRTLLREQTSRLLDEQFRSIDAQIQARWQQVRAQAWGAGRKSITEEFSRTARCLRLAENTEQWVEALLNQAKRFAQRVAVFAVEGDSLVLRARTGFPEGTAGGFTLDIGQAPALKHAAESMDTVVAMRSAGEVSEAILRLGGDEGPRKVLVVPLAGRKRALALLYAEAGETPVDLSGLELLANLGAASLELRQPRQPEELVAIASPPAPLVQAEPPRQPPAAPVPPPAAVEEPPLDPLHLRALRFARVRVAQMVLANGASISAGRRAGNLYGALRQDIDRCRDDFREQFLSRLPGMTDYLHQEISRTLANHDDALLGPEYPGPMR